MSEPALALDVLAWLGSDCSDALERETLASLRIRAGAEVLTEIEDRVAHTVRDRINVSAYAVAHWLTINWWRLRWEPFRSGPDWLRTHSMAAIGGGFAWPSLTFASDGEFVRMEVRSEDAPDVSAIRYLRNVGVDVPAADFERAVDRFSEEVEARIAARLPGERTLSELREELAEERADTSSAELCKLQGVAGMAPGEASEEWLRDARGLLQRQGARATEELLAAVESNIGAAGAAVDAIRGASTTVKLDWVSAGAAEENVRELPWERGERLARGLRSRLALGSGPLVNDVLEKVLDVRLPLEPVTPMAHALRGGYRNGQHGGRTAILMTKNRGTGQRFELARIIGAALVSSDEDSLLPVSNAGTSLQKFERSFAREFLCPWTALDAFTDEHGMDEEAIEAAAEYFDVSEHLVLATLGTKRKLSREHLPE
jgi:hypothetical protein